jgi:chromosome partitioning protein
MIVAVAAQEGGCAKTTTTVHLAAALAERGRRPLIMDLDAQGHATFWLLGDEGRVGGPFVQDWLEGRAPVGRCIRAAAGLEVGVLPANLALNRLRDRLDPIVRPKDARLLSGKIGELGTRFDCVLMDCPAGLNSLTINALYAADGVVVPVAPPEALAVDGMHHMMVTVGRIAASANPRLRLLGVLVGNVQASRAGHRRHEQHLRSLGLPLFETTIPASALIGSAAERHKSVLSSAPASAVAAAYRAVAVELEVRAVPRQP